LVVYPAEQVDDQVFGSHELRVLTPTEIFQVLNVQFKVNGKAVKDLAVG
jgi:hypothetical protein